MLFHLASYFIHFVLSHHPLIILHMYLALGLLLPPRGTRAGSRRWGAAETVAFQKKPMDDNDNIFFIPVSDNVRLQCRQNEMPVYISMLKTTISIGHNVIVSSSQERSFIGQIIDDHVALIIHVILILSSCPNYHYLFINQVDLSAILHCY